MGSKSTVGQKQVRTRANRFRRTSLFVLGLFVFCLCIGSGINADERNPLNLDSESAPARIDDALMTHTVMENGDILVQESIDLTIHSEMSSLVLVYDFSQAINAEMTALSMSIDTGEGYGMPIDVTRKNGESEDRTNVQSSQTPKYQLIRSSGRESLHIIYSFRKGSLVKLNLAYSLTGALDRYPDAGLLRRYIIDDEFDYPITHLKAEFLFPEGSSDESIDFESYPFYRWQKPVRYSITEERRAVSVEVFDVPANYGFEFVLAYPESLFMSVPYTENSDILPSLDQELEEISRREQAVGAVSSWFDQSFFYIAVVLAALAFLVAATIHFTDVMRGRRDKLGPYMKYPPLGISLSGLSFLVKRKVTGQDIYAVMIALVGMGLLHYDKNIFVLAEPVLPDGLSEEEAEALLQPSFDSLTGRWMVFGRKGAVYLNPHQMIVYKHMRDLNRTLDGFSPAVLEKMSRTHEHSSTYYRFIAEYAQSVKDELAAKGLFDKHLRRTILLSLMSVLYVVLAIVSFVLTLSWFSWLILIPGVLMGVLTLNIRSLSGIGHWTLHHTLMFRRYLTRFASLPAVEQPPTDSMITLFTYALALGVEAEFLDELYKIKTHEELIGISFYRLTGTADLMRATLADTEKDRQSSLETKMKQRFREGRVDMIGMVFNSKHFSKL